MAAIFRHLTSTLLLIICFSAIGPDNGARAAEQTFPVVIRMRYEAVDPRAGGSFIIWLDREKVWHGLDPRLYPAVKYVQVSHITPAPGSPGFSVIEVTNINATTPEFYHVAGIVRFKITGMQLKSSNLPGG